MAAAMCALGLLLSAAGASAQLAPFWPVERPPRPLPAREVTFPPYEIRTLANGMQVIAVLHHEQPAVTMRLLVKAGGAQDPEGKRGVASLVASLLDEGTTTRASQEIADQIDSIGGLLSTGSGDDFTSVNVVVMKDSFDLGMDLLADLARNPEFAPDEIERQMEQAISSQRVSENDPDYVASVLFDRLVYGFHPYGLPGSGTEETLQNIERRDLQQFHRQYFVPNNMVLAIVGDVTRDEAFGAAERVFGGWARADVPRPAVVDPPEPTRRMVVVDKPDAVQTEIRVGQLAIPRNHPDYLAWDVTVKILGGEGANRLHRVLRSERGLTYGASAVVGARKQAGDYMAETDTRTDATGEALRLMIEEFSRLQRQRVGDRELADAQAYLAGSFPLTIETPNQIAAQIIQNVIHELPVEEITTYRERVLAITPDDIQRVAREYIRPDRLSVVLVGDARAFVPQLRSVGFTDFEVIPIEQLDLMSATLKREPIRAAAEPSTPPRAFESLASHSFESRARPTGTAYVAGQINPITGVPERPASQQRPDAPDVPGAPDAPARPNAPNAPGAPTAGDSNVQNASSVLLRRVIEAKGGLEALKRVRTVVVDSETVLQMQQGTLPSKTRTYVAYPDRLRVDADVQGAQVVQVFNGGTGWVKDPGGVRDVMPAMLAEMAASVRRDLFNLLIGAAEGRLRTRVLPAEKGRDGRPLQVLEISGSQVDPVRVMVEDTMLIAGVAYAMTGPAGQVLAEEVFSDYRTVEGVRIPFEAQVLYNGQPIMRRTFTRVALNEPIPDSVFVRPL